MAFTGQGDCDCAVPKDSRDGDYRRGLARINFFIRDVRTALDPAH